MTKKINYIATPLEMLAFGSMLSNACDKRGAWIYLSGNLGIGKTTLVRGFLKNLGYKDHVKSPTYALVEPYEIEGKTIFHFDFYRIAQPEDLMQFGLEEYFTNAAICLVEWPDRFMNALPTPDILISIVRESHTDDKPVVSKITQLDTHADFFNSRRQLNIQTHTARGDAIMESLYV